MRPDATRAPIPETAPGGRQFTPTASTPPPVANGPRTRGAVTVQDARALLTGPEPASHAGQIFFSGLGSFAAGAAATHVERAAKVQAGPAYKRGFERFRNAASTIGAHVKTMVTAHPMAIGLGVSSPIEVGITLHATYGVPFVPGEALKNVAKRAAHHFEGDPDETRRALETVFGTQEVAGAVEFWGGWAEPDQRTLSVDVVTPHHGEYYATSGGTPASDFDDPNPVPFLVVPAGVRFFFAVGCFDAGDWNTLAWRFAEYGLRHEGVGGRINAGYGTFTGD